MTLILFAGVIEQSGAIAPPHTGPRTVSGACTEEIFRIIWHWIVSVAFEQHSAQVTWQYFFSAICPA